MTVTNTTNGVDHVEGAGALLRLARVPQGPTLTLRIERYTLSKHLRASMKRSYDSPSLYTHAPLVVLNNFGNTEGADAASAPATPPHVKLMRITFQNLFPALDVATMNLADCKRVVLFHYNREEETVEMRQCVGRLHQQPPPPSPPPLPPPLPPPRSHHHHHHHHHHLITTTNTHRDHHLATSPPHPRYAIRAKPTSLSRPVKRLLDTKKALPDLGHLDDVADWILGAAEGGMGGDASDSEVEDEASQVTLAHKVAGRGNHKDQKAAIKLSEIGEWLGGHVLL